jgi:hypothetical protein
LKLNEKRDWFRWFKHFLINTPLPQYMKNLLLAKDKEMPAPPAPPDCQCPICTGQDEMAERKPALEAIQRCDFPGVARQGQGDSDAPTSQPEANPKPLQHVSQQEVKDSLWKGAMLGEPTICAIRYANPKNPNTRNDASGCVDSLKFHKK